MVRQRIVWLGLVLFLAVILLYVVHLLASQGTSNPWVTFPIYSDTNASEVAMDWPLVTWVDWPIMSQPTKVLVKNLETGALQDLGDILPCAPVGTGRGDLALYGEWLVGNFACNYPYSTEIHAFNLNSQELITIPTPIGLPSQQTFAAEPAIYGQHIVWQQEDWTVGRSDIFLFDLQSRTTISLTQTASPVIEVHPEIYQDWIAWNTLNLSTGDNNITLYNLSSSEWITIPLAFPYDTEVSLDNQYVVWTDFRNGSNNADIYGFDLVSRQELAVIAQPYHQSDAVISDGIVVYREQGPPVTLNAYHINTAETYSFFQPSEPTGLRPVKAMDNGTVVWIYSAVGPEDIVYGAQQLPERFFLPIFRQP